MMELNGQHVSEFSPNGKLFALINELGILKIWDTETNELKQEFTPNLHLAGPCTCLTWVVVSGSQRKPNSKKSRKSIENTDHGSEQMYVALGTSRGGVTMYSYSLGKVERSLAGEGHSSRVNSIKYDGSNLLYTVGDDCNVVVWSVTEEKMLESWLTGTEKPHSVLCLPSGNILIGARQLKLFSLNPPALIQTFTGHASEIILLSHFVLNSVEYGLSASKMERIISLWTLNSRRKSKPPACTFLMEDIAHCLCSSIDDDDNIKIAAVTRSGVIHIYLNSFTSIKPEKPIKPKVTIQIASDTLSIIRPIPAITVSFSHGSGKKNILFGYGDKHFLRFEQIAPNYSEKLQVLTKEDPKKWHLQNSKKQFDNALKTITPIVPNNVEYTSSTTFSKKKMTEIQMPMETRLQNLHLENGEFPKAESKVQLLIQSLHSKDATLLMSVLSTTNPKVIQLTLQKLPVQYISSLINELTLLMNKKRANVQIASNWFKVLVMTHSSQLMALGADDLLTKFGPCLGIIEHRSNCLKDLSKLHGRLHLLLNQIRRNNDADALNNDNVLVYEDQDSSSSDLDEPYYARDSSDGEYAEDDSDEEMDVVKDNTE